MKLAFAVIAVVLAAVEAKKEEKVWGCTAQGGECRLQVSRCCEGYMDFDDSLCPPGEMCCFQNYPEDYLHQQNTLCFAKDNYNLYGSTDYDPGVQVTKGCASQTGIARGPKCPGPKYVMLNPRILNLLQCVPKVNCGAGTVDKWKILNLLNSISYFQNNCDGKSVLLERRRWEIDCDVTSLDVMCKDVGGTASKAVSSWKCQLP